MLRYSFLEFVTPSPFSLWFYKAMGMRVGRGSVINSTHISDPSLLHLGKKVTVGGSATIVAHYGQAGFLVLSPVIIEDDVTIGLRATIMGGVKIRKGAKILPNSVVMPKTEVPAGEVWGGVPAHKLDLKKVVASEPQ
jgi:acetyltransferase-like isoleucine patch superfamily enzyme